ncbi:PLP-dependent cysteine synthase family protein [Sandaracinus amylolyticus]|uniref:PLP-dependent cysteine synthase family protein n=1 Tax=Sandaracinus amylolyticus TaxID=927083 RepID=UPI001F1D25DB|nr:cysteine synthase family protein [Sandaracinus amylolyticus]UJR79440.1 Pyridoxal-phosphate dependent enzyme [Sandaracinus amylolyticus]
MSLAQRSIVERKAWLARLAGSTPCVPVDDPETGCTIWLKLEYLLPSGSTKDRVASFILSHGVETGAIREDSIVVEASSGSTSIAFAMACAALGVRFCAVMPENVSRERMLIIKRYGGECVLTPQAGGLVGAIEETRAMAARDARVFLARQFENPLNARAHERHTGPELIAQVGTTIHGFVAGVGTGGTLMGIASALRDAGHPVRVARAMPEKNSPCFSGQPEICGGIPGVVDGLSAILDPARIGLDDDVRVLERDAIDAARSLCRRGFPVGPSSGLNYAAARALARRLGPGHTLATVLCDRMERYFSTDLFQDVCG